LYLRAIEKVAPSLAVNVVISPIHNEGTLSVCASEILLEHLQHNQHRPTVRRYSGGRIRNPAYYGPA